MTKISNNIHKETTPYLDIYKNEGKIVFQLGKDIFLDKNSTEFFEYLSYLEKQNINFILLDEDGKEIFSSNGNPYFLENNKEDISDKINNILLLVEIY